MTNTLLSDRDKDELIAALRAAVAARDEFIAVAAHELRNPMTPVMAQVHLLLTRARREQCSPAIVGGLELLATAVDHYVKRASTLLEISRLNAGQVPLEPTVFDLAELLRQCVSSYALIAERSGTMLRCTADGAMVGTWDRLATEQVIENLISNAVRYGDAKPVDIELHGDERRVVIQVTDRGIGIAPEHQERIFERFEQANKAGRSGGFGIGLWLARNLVQAQGGRLEVHSQLGAGSIFKVTLPRSIRPPDEDASSRE
jgi:two-component system OmpR family sensor kinase